jgi:hypothetical protein
VITPPSFRFRQVMTRGCKLSRFMTSQKSTIRYELLNPEEDEKPIPPGGGVELQVLGETLNWCVFDVTKGNRNGWSLLRQELR